MRGYEVIARRLVAAGVDTVFAVMGDGNLHLLAELSDRHGVRIVHARHEQGAVSMADGYSRFTGRLGVATVTHGPGLTNTATALATAAAHGSPVLLVAGGLRADDVHNLQRLDQPAFAAVLGVRPTTLTSGERIGVDVDVAMRLCETGQTVLLHAPTDVQLAPSRDLPPATPRMTAAPPAPDPDTVDRVATLLEKASRPVLLAGRGARSDAAIAAVGDLARHLGAPVVTTLLGKGNFASHPYNLGVAGGLGDRTATRALANSDCVVAFGASLNEWTTSKHDFRDGATLVQVDTDVQAFGRFAHPQFAVLADSELTARALKSAVRADVAGTQVESVNEGAAPDEDYDDGDGTVDPRRACRAIHLALPHDRAVVVDGGHVCIWGTQLIGTSLPRSFTHGFSFGSIAQSLGLAIGAALGLGGRRVAAVMGDGAAAMSLFELETAVRTNAPVSVIVLNDSGFGIERHTLAAEGLPVTEADYPPPAFAEIARAMGARAERIASPSDLALLPEILGGSGPSLVDVVVNGSLVSETFRKIKQLIPVD